ncbi:hypothetical protein BDW74DRAFT_146982 [Aspergillus multicolor]|uniref:uncharacterized protein n=1 Tax=Aspergillus multicolor TaxID=41759 RepID=UPI003CCD2CB5
MHTPTFKPPGFDEFVSSSSNITTIDSDAPVREIIHNATQIQRLACACLSKALQNFMAAHSTILPAIWQGNPIVNVTGNSSFAWIEEFRVNRALWRFRLYSDIWHASKQWNWTLDDIERIPALKYINEHARVSYDTQTVATILRELGVPSLGEIQLDTISIFDSKPFPLFASL